MGRYFAQNRADDHWDHEVIPVWADTTTIMDVTKMPPALKKLGRQVLDAYYETTHKSVPVGQWWLVFDSAEFIEACKNAGFTGIKFKEDRSVRKAAGSEGFTYMIFDPGSIKLHRGVSITDFYNSLK
jgi:hypothetical protein